MGKAANNVLVVSGIVGFPGIVKENRQYLSTSQGPINQAMTPLVTPTKRVEGDQGEWTKYSTLGIQGKI